MSGKRIGIIAFDGASIANSSVDQSIGMATGSRVGAIIHGPSSVSGLRVDQTGAGGDAVAAHIIHPDRPEEHVVDSLHGKELFVAKDGTVTLK
jgi:hypothetical protein